MCFGFRSLRGRFGAAKFVFRRLCINWGSDEFGSANCIIWRFRLAAEFVFQALCRGLQDIFFSLLPGGFHLGKPGRGEIEGIFGFRCGFKRLVGRLYVHQPGFIYIVLSGRRWSDRLGWGRSDLTLVLGLGRRRRDLTLILGLGRRRSDLALILGLGRRWRDLALITGRLD